MDDGAFQRADRRAPIALVVVALPEQLEAVGTGSVRVDGTDATGRIARLWSAVAPPEGVRALLVDGAVVGGFNVVDLDRLHRRVGVPVIAVTRRAPDFSRIRAALLAWFPRTGRARYATLRRHRLFRVPTGGAPLWAACVGCPRADALALVRRVTVRGYWPEPLRLAHLVASAPATGSARSNENSIRAGRPRPRRGPVA